MSQTELDPAVAAAAAPKSAVCLGCGRAVSPDRPDHAFALPARARANPKKSAKYVLCLDLSCAAVATRTVVQELWPAWATQKATDAGQKLPGCLAPMPDYLYDGVENEIRGLVVDFEAAMKAVETAEKKRAEGGKKKRKAEPSGPPLDAGGDDDADAPDDADDEKER